MNGQLFAPPRRWQEGARLEVDGIRFRVVLGRKATPDDLTIDLRLEHQDSAGRWRPTKMSLVVMLVDFFAENESGLHPVINGEKGGGKILESCRRAARNGWEDAVKGIDIEKRRKRVSESQS